MRYLLTDSEILKKSNRYKRFVENNTIISEKRFLCVISKMIVTEYITN